MMANKDPVAAAAQKYKPMQSAVPGTTLGPIQIDAFYGGAVCSLFTFSFFLFGRASYGPSIICYCECSGFLIYSFSKIPATVFHS